MIDSDANLNVRPVGPSFLVVDGNLLIFGPLYLTGKLRAISTSAANNLKGLGCFWSEVILQQFMITFVLQVVYYMPNEEVFKKGDLSREFCLVNPVCFYKFIHFNSKRKRKNLAVLAMGQPPKADTKRSFPAMFSFLRSKMLASTDIVFRFCMGRAI